MQLLAKYLFLFSCLMALSFVLPEKKEVTVYLIGDSTMCDYELGRAPITGWGMPFRYFFDSSVRIANHAKGGRSTRTFLSENRWQPIVDQLKEGDFVIIQFGHNDEAKEEKYKDRYTPVADYKTNLVKFISETRTKKATPILVTPVSRMRFKDGMQQETHVEYTAAAHEIAMTENVPIIDLDKKSRELYQQLGPEQTKLLFMQLKPGEHPVYPEGQNDNTHFNEYGARRIAQLVLASLRENQIPLANYIVKPGKK